MSSYKRKVNRIRLDIYDRKFNRLREVKYTNLIKRYGPETIFVNGKVTIRKESQENL